MKNLLVISFIAVALFSCSPYQKALKSEDVAVKFDQATLQYEKGKYNKAIRLFEQLAPSYRGKPQAEQMFYMFSQAYYKTEQYYLAGYQFENFASSYPKSDKLEEASFLGAKCYSKLSPVYRRKKYSKTPNSTIPFQTTSRHLLPWIFLLMSFPEPNTKKMRCIID